MNEDHDDIPQTTHITVPSRIRSRDPLLCLPKCECRCHYPSIIRLLPVWLAFYTGQISVSKHLLRSPLPCNVQTCRRDAKRAYTVQWILPAGFLQGCLQSSKHSGRIHFLMGAPRIVPFNAPIYYAILDGNFECVRDLFATGQASIWDYSVVDLPIFWVSQIFSRSHYPLIRSGIEGCMRSLAARS